MIKEKHGQVVKVISNRYTVKSDDLTFIAHARGKIKLDKEIFVGDYVSFIEAKPFAVITGIEKRKNSLTRPYVANIDIVLIVIAKEPEPDYLLVDKILINCYKEGITPVICYNKIDLEDEDKRLNVLSEYKSIVDCLHVSASQNIGLEELLRYAKGNLVCLAGQSAVGKTSLLNAILDLNLKTDKLSAKIKRGKNTTRHVEIYDVYGMHIVDTCGFSMLELLNIEPEELKYYYSEFIEYKTKCKYTSCNHVNEDGCAIIDGVAKGEIDKGRYLRYINIYSELKEKREKNNQ